MSNYCMIAIGWARGVVGLAAVYVSPITLLLCMIVVPGGIALAVVSYVYSREAEEEEEQADEEQAAHTRSMSTRQWYAERYVPCALDDALLHSIPMRAFTSAMATQMTSSCCCCVVCLAPFQVAELLKLLPPCHHAFHVACIDRWFESHSTCPICRCQVSAPFENAVHQDVTLNVMAT